MREQPETVVLIHGIWMTGLEELLLARRLRGFGYRCLMFRYASLRRSPAANAAALEDLLREQAPARCHFVAHSLGGIVLLHLFHRWPTAPPGRAVLIGSPLRGSGVARRMARTRWLRWALGRSTERGLLGDVPPVPADRELGMIAGTRGLGVGRVIGGLEHPDDGTVAVEETRVPGLADWTAFHATHFELLFSRPVSEAVRAFLQTGRFP